MGLDGKQSILVVHNYYQIPGGEDTVVANEISLLREHGHRVLLYSRSNAELKAMGTARKLLLPLSTVFNPRTYREVRRLIRRNRIDIVHVHNTLNLISPAVYYAALAEGVPVVQTVHNFRLVCPGATFYRDGHICEDCLRRGLLCSVRHACYRHSRLQTLVCAAGTAIHRGLGIYRKLHYICLTEFTREKIQTVAAAEHIHVKPNFVYDFGGEAHPEDYYVFVGRVEEIKGIDVLIEAFRRMPGRRLKVVGTGGMEDDVRKRIQSGQMTNIELMGFRPRDEVNQILRGARALIMCSQWYETFGMVIAEAYSNGVPAIVGDIGNIRGLVVEGETGELFTYNSPDALVDAVERFERNQDTPYGGNAYRFYRERFAPEANYRMLEAIYAGLRG